MDEFLTTAWPLVRIISGALSLIVFCAVTLPRHMHMFQLNSYQAAGQLSWLKSHWKECWPQFFALLFLIMIILARIFYANYNKSTMPQMWVFIVFYVFFRGIANKISAVKKPLVYTPRVKRMFVTIAVLVLAVIAAAGLLYDGRTMRSVVLLLILLVLTPLLPILANFINAPIEAYIRHWFQKDAQRILRAHETLEIVGITGSYGKTSVKYYLTELLRGQFDALMTPESYNTPMGISKTIRTQLRASHQIFVCEMGARGVGEIQELCDLVQPRHGIVTAVGEQHLETFKSRENILHEKLALARAVTSGHLFVGGDSEPLRTNRPANAITYGLRQDNDCYGYDIHCTVRGTTFSVNLQGEIWTDLRTPLIGAHSVCNLVGAIAMARALGVTQSDIRRRLTRLAPPPHRLALTRQGNEAIIDDAYNSNPAGAKAALDTLALFEGMKILITPGMVELGAEQFALNRALGQQAAAMCDYVIAVGARQAPPIVEGLAAEGYPAAQTYVAQNFNEAIAHARALPYPGDKIILLENDLPDNY